MALGCDGAVFLVQAPAAVVHEGILVWQDDNNGENFWPIRISADGKYVCTGTFGGHGGLDVFGWFVCYDQTGKSMWNYTTEWETAYWAHDLDLSADGQYAVGVENSTIYFFDKTGLKWTYDTNNPTDLGHVRISADGNFVIARARNNQYDIWHLNKFGKLIWHIPSSDGMGRGPIAISANGEYFCSADFLSAIYKYFSKKYFSYRFVTVDPAPLPITNLNVSWYFGNGTLYSSALTDSSGWIALFDPYFVDYRTEAYYWQTKVGQYTLVTSTQYESVSDQVASIFDWNVYIHDAADLPITARVETYLWNGTLYDNQTASSLRFEDLPNQTYTFKAYYPSARGTWALAGQQSILLTQEEQNSTISTSIVDYHVKCVDYYDDVWPSLNVSLSVNGYPEWMRVQTNGTGFADFTKILTDTYRIIIYYQGVAVANITDMVQLQDQIKTVHLFGIGDTQPPLINAPSRTPLQPSTTDTVKVSVNVTDDLAGVHDVVLSYNSTTSLSWTNVTMTYNSTSMLYEGNIPPQPAGTTVSYMITAHDNAGKQSVNDNQTSYFVYPVIPEFPVITMLLMFFVAAAPLLLLFKSRAKKRLDSENPRIEE